MLTANGSTRQAEEVAVLDSDSDSETDGEEDDET